MTGRRNTGSAPRVISDDPRARRASQALSGGLASGQGVGVDNSGRFTALLGDALYYDDRGRIQIRTGGGLTIAPGSPRRLIYDPTTAEARTILILAQVTTDDVKAADGTGDSVTLLLQRLQYAYQAADSSLDARIDVLEAAPAGTGNALDVVVDFGSTFTHFAQTVVTGEAWVAADSKILAMVTGSNAMEQALMQFSTTVTDLVAGDGFTLSVYTPIKAKGTYTFSCLGV